MSSAYNFVPTNRATAITIPSDGDAPIKAADVNPALQYIGDLAANAIARVEPVASTVALAAILAPTDGLTRYVIGFGLYTFKTAVPTITTIDPWVIAATDGTPGRWVSADVFLRIGATGGAAISSRKFPARKPFGISAVVAFSTNQDALTGVVATDVTQTVTGGSAFTNVNNASSDARQMYFDLTPYLIHGATLSSVVAGITPAAHGGGLPARMPRLAVVRHALPSSVIQSLYSGSFYSDTSGSTGVYVASHEFGGAMDQNNVIDLNAYAYQVFIANEAGANAQTLLSVNYFKIEQG